MRELFSAYRQLSAQVQALLRSSLERIAQGLATDEALGRDIAQALNQLHAAHEAIRAPLNKYLPDGEPTIDEYERAWLGSLAGRKETLCGVLGTFMRAHSDDAKYMGALSAYIGRARALVDCIGAVDSIEGLPDVSEYQLFLDCMGVDLAANEELSERIWDSTLFSPRVVRGLAEGKYRIPTDDEPTRLEPAPEPTSEPADEPAAEPASELPPEPTTEPATETVHEQATEPAVEPASELPPEPTEIRPLFPIAPGKMPAEKKIANILSDTEKTSYTLIPALCAYGMLDERMLYEMLKRRDQQYSTMTRDLSKLAHNGYISTYVRNFRRIICFTQQMISCMQFSSALGTVRRFLRANGFAPKPPFCARNSVPIAEFDALLHSVDLAFPIVDKINFEFHSLYVPPTKRDADTGRFAMQFKAVDGKFKSEWLLCVGADEYANAPCTPKLGAICMADKLPDMDGVSDDLHYCLTTYRLYRWVDGHWSVVAERDGIARAKPKASSPDGAKPTGKAAPVEGGAPDEAAVPEASDSPEAELPTDGDSLQVDAPEVSESPEDDLPTDGDSLKVDEPEVSDSPEAELSEDGDSLQADLSEVSESLEDNLHEYGDLPQADLSEDSNSLQADEPEVSESPEDDLHEDGDLPQADLSEDSDSLQADLPEVSESPEAELPTGGDSLQADAPEVNDSPEADLPTDGDFLQVDEPELSDSPEADLSESGDSLQVDEPEVSDSPEAELPEGGDFLQADEPEVSDSPEADLPEGGDFLQVDALEVNDSPEAKLPEGGDSLQADALEVNDSPEADVAEDTVAPEVNVAEGDVAPEVPMAEGDVAPDLAVTEGAPASEADAPHYAAPARPAQSEGGQSDWLWHDDAAYADNAPCAVEMASRLADSPDIPSDESLAAVIQKLLAEGVRSHEPHNMHDQLVEAIVLAQLLAKVTVPGPGDEVTYRFPICRSAYLQLNAAIPMFDEPDYPNTDDVLTEVFSQQFDFSSAAQLCAHISGMLFPLHSHNYALLALCNSALDNYDSTFPGLEALKPLYRWAISVLSKVSNSFSPANLAMLSDSRLRKERMSAIQARARALFELPTLRARINGIPEFLDMCFGQNSEIYAALEIVAANDPDGRDLVAAVLNRYSRNDKIDERKLNQTVDNLWPVAAKGYSTSRLTLKMLARRNVLDAFRDRLEVMRQWVDETGEGPALDTEMLRSLRDKVLQVMDEAIANMCSAPQSAQRCIVLSALESMRARLQGESGAPDQATLLRSGLLPVDESGLAFNESLNEIRFAEPWYMMLRHIACTNYNLANAYSAIINATSDSPYYDNYGQLKVLGRILGANPDEYDPSEDVLRSASNIAILQTRTFRESLEISYAYNRISERDRERFALLTDPNASDFQSFFFERQAYGGWRGFLGALRMQIEQITQHNVRVVQSQLEQARSQLPDDEFSPLLEEADRLIVEQRNLAVAEDYIHRFRNGETSLPFENIDSMVNHYLNFISNNVYPRLLAFCQENRERTLSSYGKQYLVNNRPIGWSTRHFEDANKFISKWPYDKKSLNPNTIGDLFRLMGLDVVSSERYTRRGEVCCTLTVNRSPQNIADYRHPIAAFGTQMKPQLEVVCLFGNRRPRQLIDEACQMDIKSMYVVLLDSALTLAERCAMAEYFFTQKNVGQAPFLVIDRVLALYLTMQSSNERLPAMLQCTLPYTIYQPFTNGSGSTVDEMFFGRSNELASIRDMAGTSVVYGGRQLGKTALLERAKHLDNNPDRGEFAIMTSLVGCRGVGAFLGKLVGACNDAFAGHDIELSSCADMADFCSQIGRLLNNTDKVARLLLLLDETDDFLESISANDYRDLQPLVDLQRASERRFKFVLVGLHNVCRANNAMRKNGLFGQLGAPLCIKPLTAADARNLLVRPLRYLGFHVSSESHIDTLLINTNYYPGIIQFFGYSLVQTLSSQYLHYYSALNNNPPFELRDDHLASIMSSRDLNNSIKSRLLMTLSMDERYHMLARCIAVLYHIYSNEYVHMSSGFSAQKILEVARDMFDIRCLAGLSEGEVATLLDEMEEMGILSRNDDSGSRYLLRRRSFVDVIGPNLDALGREIELANEEAAGNG